MNHHCDTFLFLGFVFTCFVSVFCTKGRPLSTMGQLLCQQDMGLIMKNSKASVQVSDGSVLSVYTKVCSYCVLADSFS